MTTSGKGKGANEKPAEAPSVEAVFGALEERVDRLSARVVEIGAENARLRAAVTELAATRDRLRRELEDARELSALQGAEASKLKRYEEEREAVRGRIERLIKTLEEAESALAPRSA